MLSYCAYIAKSREVTEIDVERLSVKEFSYEEMRELRDLPREDLMLLMRFCDIRVYEDVPVIACEEDELRMAFVLWRSHEIEKRKMKVRMFSQKIKRLKRLLKLYIQIAKLYG